MVSKPGFAWLVALSFVSKAAAMYHVIVRKTVRPSPSRPVQKCRRPSAEDLFGRIMDKSDTIRRACGFDSELYDAIQGLSAR